MNDTPADTAKAPLLTHLIELRNRLISCVVVFVLATGASYFFADSIYAFLVQPLADSFADSSHKRLIYTGLAEAFVTYVKLAMFAGFFITFPVIAYHFYQFVAPGLYKKEKRVLLPYLLVSPTLFVMGAALAYYYIFPLAWTFFISFETPAASGTLPIQLEAKVSDYLALVMQILIAFGMAFQLPVILTLLARVGFLTSAQLAKWRRYAVVILLSVAAILTPPDILSQIGLFIPLYLLYELSIVCCKYVEKGSEVRDQGSGDTSLTS